MLIWAVPMRWAAWSRGYTLVELLIALVMLALLATLAYPSLRAPVLRARRIDGTLALLQMQLAQERWRASSSRYGSASELQAPARSPAGHYRLSVESPTAHGFALRAEAQGSQADDIACRVLLLRQGPDGLSRASGPDGATANAPEANRGCWAS